MQMCVIPPRSSAGCKEDSESKEPSEIGVLLPCIKLKTAAPLVNKILPAYNDGLDCSRLRSPEAHLSPCVAVRRAPGVDPRFSNKERRSRPLQAGSKTNKMRDGSSKVVHPASGGAPLRKEGEFLAQALP